MKSAQHTQPTGAGYLLKWLLSNLCLFSFFTATTQDLQDIKSSSFTRSVSSLETTGIPGFPCYRTVEETYDAGYFLAFNNPGLATWKDIGKSWEKKQTGTGGYDIYVLKITNSSSPYPKSPVLVTAGLHARELAPVELATRFAEYLVTSYNQDPDITWILDHTEIHIVLNANPDGRKRAEQQAAVWDSNTGSAASLWRKNTNFTDCFDGVDLNRNFLTGWDPGIWPNCNETYPGPYPGSEPETMALIDYAKEYVFKGQPGGIFLDIHSPPPATMNPCNDDDKACDEKVSPFSGERILWPWGWNEQPPNEPELRALGKKIAWYTGGVPRQIKELRDNLYEDDCYKNCRIHNCELEDDCGFFYGTSSDYFFATYQVPAYTFEIGTTFFEPCANFPGIQDHYFQSLIYVLKAARAPYHLGSGPVVESISLSRSNVIAGDTVTLYARVTDDRFSKKNGIEPIHEITEVAYTISTLPAAFSGNTGESLKLLGGISPSIKDAQAKINTASLGPGKHLIYVHALDASGHWGVVSATWLNVLEAREMAFGFTGIVTSVDTIGNDYPIDFLLEEYRFQPGDSFAGAFMFDATTSDSYWSLPNDASYINAVTWTTIAFSNGWSGSGTESQPEPYGVDRIQVNDLAPTYLFDMYYVNSSKVDGPNILSEELNFTARRKHGNPRFMNIFMVDSSGQVFDSDALPVHPPSIQAFDTVLFTMGFGSSSKPNMWVHGKIESFSIVPVNIITAVDKKEQENTFETLTIYPNPASQEAKIAYNLEKPGAVQFLVYNLLGRQVARIDEGWQPAGKNSFLLDTSLFPNGTYLNRMITDGKSVTKYMIITR